MLCFKEVLVLSAVACFVSPKAVPLGAHGIFKLCKKPHFINFLHSTTTFPPPVDYSVTSKYTSITTPTTTEVYATPEPVSSPHVVPQQQILYPPQHSVQPPSQQQVPYPPQPELQDPSQQQVFYPPQQYAVPYPQQQQVLYPPQHEGQDLTEQPQVSYPPQQDVVPYPPQEYVAPNPPKQEVVQNPPPQQQQQVQYTPQQQQDVQYPPQQQQDVQNPPPQQEAQYPPQQQQEVQYPPQQQQQQQQAQTPPQQQVQNSPPYYQGVPFSNVYGPPEYYYQQQQVTNPFKKSLGHLINHKFSNGQLPYTAVYVQQPYPYDYYPTPLYYQLSQAHKKPQISHPVIKSKP